MGECSPNRTSRALPADRYFKLSSPSRSRSAPHGAYTREHEGPGEVLARPLVLTSRHRADGGRCRIPAVRPVRATYPHPGARRRGHPRVAVRRGRHRSSRGRSRAGVEGRRADLSLPPRHVAPSRPRRRGGRSHCTEGGDSEEGGGQRAGERGARGLVRSGHAGILLARRAATLVPSGGGRVRRGRAGLWFRVVTGNGLPGPRAGARGFAAKVPGDGLAVEALEKCEAVQGRVRERRTTGAVIRPRGCEGLGSSRGRDGPSHHPGPPTRSPLGAPFRLGRRLSLQPLRRGFDRDEGSGRADGNGEPGGGRHQ